MPHDRGHLRGLGPSLALGSALLLAACTFPGEESRREGPTTGATGGVQAEVNAPSDTIRSTSLANLPEIVAEVEALRQGSQPLLAGDAAEQAASFELSRALVWLSKARSGGAAASYDEVLEMSHRLATEQQRVVRSGRVVTDRLRAVEARRRQVSELRKSLDAHADSVEAAAAPPQIAASIRLCRSALDDLDARLEEHREEILVDVSRLAEVRGSLAVLAADNEMNVSDLRDRIAYPSAAPIWHLAAGRRITASLTEGRAAREAWAVGEYARENMARLAFVAAGVLAGMTVLIKKLRPGAARRAEVDPGAVEVLRVMEAPWAASILVTLVTLVLLAPLAPSIVYEVAWIPAALAAASIVVKLVGPEVSRAAWVLAASLALFPLRSMTEFGQLADRVLLLVQTVPLGLVLADDLLRRRWVGHLATGHRSPLLSLVAWLLATALGISALASVGGWVVLAAVLSSGALRSLGAAIVIMASFLVLDEVLRGLVASRAAQSLRMVRLHPDEVASAARQALRVAAIVTAGLAAVVEFGVWTRAGRALRSFLDATLTLGSMSISVVSVLTFSVILALATAMSRLASFVLAEELLPRLNLGRGAAFAISVTSRYLILLAGFVLAAGAAGIDLSKMGFLAGALGVGIGFGLQNVVSNFVCGLIVLLERPIRIGDAIEVSGTSGHVSRIGIRSSTVRTFDGADIYIPNADLISKPVTNWTRSDPNRRFDVPVSVAYGSPLEATARALLIAARRTPGVVPLPAPEAFLASFGANALVWHVRLWMLFEDSPTVLSQLNQAVAEELAKAHIEVPLPQLDVHVRADTPGAPLPDGDRLSEHPANGEVHLGQQPAATDDRP